MNEWDVARDRVDALHARGDREAFPGLDEIRGELDAALTSLQQELERLRKAAREYLDLAAEALDLRYDDSYLTKPEEVNLGAAEAALRAALDSQAGEAE